MTGSDRSFLPRLGALLGLLLFQFNVAAERLPVRIYTSSDGLGSSAINYIMRDSRGFLWFCTRDGLSRFDGYRFTTYRIGSRRTSPTINYLLEARSGIYWIATNGSGIYRFDPNAVSATVEPARTADVNGDERVLLNAEKVSETNVNVLYEDHNGDLWAGSVDGLYRLEEEDRRVSLRPIDVGLPENQRKVLGVNVFCEGHDGSLWVGTGWGLLRRLPDGRMIHFSIQPISGGDTVLSLLTNADGRIWAGHYGGLFVIDPEPIASLSDLGAFTSLALGVKRKDRRAQDEPVQLPEQAGEARRYTTADGLADNFISGLYQRADGHVWITTTKGLTEFDGQRLRSYARMPGLDQTSFGPLTEDQEGNLWIATVSGAVEIALNGLTSYDKADGLGDLGIHSIYEDHQGALYVVNGDWFISRFDGGAFTSIRPQIPPGAKYSWTSNVALLDRSGDWWLLINDRLTRFTGIHRIEQMALKRPTLTYSSRDGLKSDHPYRIFEDSRGDLWISTRSGDLTLNGLTRWSRATGAFHAFTEAEGFPPEKAPSSFVEDGAGHLWLGFYDGGLARYADGRFTVLTTADGVPEGFVTALYSDHMGHIWVASSVGGLSRIEDAMAARPRFKSYTTAEGLSSNNVRCLTEDRWGNIYAGTVRGIDRLTPETMRVRHYSRADGLPDDFVNVAYRDRQGVLWFGTLNGLAKLVPRPDPPPAPPPTLIGGLRIAGVKYPLSELGAARVATLELDPNQNNLQVDFFALSFGPGEHIRYQYRLEGASQGWSALAEQRTVNYANLAPGRYRFMVRAVNAAGSASTVPASVEFIILRPIWQRWWFLTLSALLLSGAIYLLYRYRVQRLLELERVRTRIAADLHDDIGASLSRVAIMSEVLKQQSGASGESADRMLTEIAESARASVDSMSDIVWSIDPHRDDLNSVISRVRQFASDVLEARGIKWEFQAPPEAERVKLDAERRRHLFLIFKEAINNIVRHAECRSARLSISVSGSRLKAEIWDDGCGFDSRLAGQIRVNGRGGHGLKNIGARANELDGRCKIATSPGEGTRVIIEFPLT